MKLKLSKKIRTISFSIIVVLLILFNKVFSQINSIPSVKIKNLKGESIDTKYLASDQNPLLIVFFGSCCSPSLKALDGLADNYSELQDKFSLKVIAISIDDSRSSKKVAPLAKGKGWLFDIYLDENSDFKRAMNVNDKPHYILFNEKGEITWQRMGYITGIEEEIQNVLEKKLK